MDNFTINKYKLDLLKLIALNIFKRFSYLIKTYYINI